MAGTDRAADRRWLRHHETHPAHRHEQDLGLAVAGALPGRGRGGPAARQDAPVAHSAAFCGSPGTRGRRDETILFGETTHWTSGAMAKHIGISISSVQRIWRAHGLQPHKTRLFKLSNDPLFAEKVVYIVGLDISPPEHAVVLSIDEKSQIQALDRTQPGLPMKKGRCGTMTHDYKRNGTTTLFAALNVLDGTVIGRCMQRHRHEEFIRFLNVTEAAVQKGKAIHAVVDNYATHKHPTVKKWLARHPRWTFHFTPTSASWLNAVEGYFAKLTKRRLQRGVFVGRRTPDGYQAVHRGHQRQPAALSLDKGSRKDYRRRETGTKR